jgi:hypothetical protein
MLYCTSGYSFFRLPGVNREHQQVSETFWCGFYWGRHGLAAPLSTMAVGQNSKSCGNIEPTKTDPHHRAGFHCTLDVLALLVSENIKIMVERRPALYHGTLSVCEASRLRRGRIIVHLWLGLDPQFLDSSSLAHTLVFHLVRACPQGRKDDGNRFWRGVQTLRRPHRASSAEICSEIADVGSPRGSHIFQKKKKVDIYRIMTIYK